MVLYTIFLYSTLTVAYRVYVSLYEQIGRDTMSQWMNLSFLVAGAVLLLFFLPLVFQDWSRILAFAMICLSVAYCLAYLEVPAKRFHFFQYAPLGVLLFDAVGFRWSGRQRYLLTAAGVAFLGLGDELIQWVLPNRHFGVPDLVVNSVAGILALCFIGFVVGEENYPRRKNS